MGVTSTVTISGVPYPVYGTHDGAGDYLAVLLTDAGTAWRAATTDVQKSAMVNAARYLDAVGLVNDDGQAITSSSGSVPDKVVQASYELAAAVLADPAVLSDAGTSSNVKRINAKGVEIEWFGPRAGGGRFPPNVALLLADYIASANAAGASSSSSPSFGGTCEGSQYEDRDRYDLT